MKKRIRKDNIKQLIKHMFRENYQKSSTTSICHVATQLYKTV